MVVILILLKSKNLIGIFETECKSLIVNKMKMGIEMFIYDGFVMLYI
jgi:hypothetical protein